MQLFIYYKSHSSLHSHLNQIYISLYQQKAIKERKKHVYAFYLLCVKRELRNSVIFASPDLYSSSKTRAFT